jgi:hypothetical protein
VVGKRSYRNRDESRSGGKHAIVISSLEGSRDEQNPQGLFERKRSVRRDRVFCIPVRKSSVWRRIVSHPSVAHSEQSKTVPPGTRDTGDRSAGPTVARSPEPSAAEIMAHALKKVGISRWGDKLRDCRKSMAWVNCKSSGDLRK